MSSLLIWYQTWVWFCCVGVKSWVFAEKIKARHFVLFRNSPVQSSRSPLNFICIILIASLESLFWSFWRKLEGLKMLQELHPVVQPIWQNSWRSAARDVCLRIVKPSLCQKIYFANLPAKSIMFLYNAIYTTFDINDSLGSLRRFFEHPGICTARNNPQFFFLI